MSGRIVTRPDFDGVVCAVLLKEALGGHMPVLWVQPNEVQKGRVPVNPDDVVANLPFPHHGGLWFDHHVSNQTDLPFKGLFRIAPSAAGLVYEYFWGRVDPCFEVLVYQADKIDSAQLSLDEILHPENYPFVIVSMAISARKECDLAFCDYLVDLFRSSDIEQVLADPEIRRRCDRVIEINRRYEKDLMRHTILEGHVAVTDFRGLGQVPEGNRYLVYSVFPQAIVNVKLFDEADHVAIKLGHSIVNRGCRVNLGNLLMRYGGGGHRGAGACRLPKSEADPIIAEIIEILRANQPIE